MRHVDVYEMFTKLHPLYCGGYTWFPHGRNTIRIKFIENLEFVFTYHNNRCWSFETLQMYNKYRIKE